MKKLLLIALLFAGCAIQPKTKIINILDGNISSGTVTLKTDDIKEDCKKECKTFSFVNLRFLELLFFFFV